MRLIQKYRLIIILAFIVQSLLFFPALVETLEKGRQGFYILMTLNLPSTILVNLFQEAISYLIDISKYYQILVYSIIFISQYLFWFLIMFVIRALFRKAIMTIKNFKNAG